MWIMSFMPEINIITQGSASDGVYFLASGFMNVYISSGSFLNTLQNEIAAGNIFGELGVMCKTERSATV